MDINILILAILALGVIACVIIIAIKGIHISVTLGLGDIKITTRPENLPEGYRPLNDDELTRFTDPAHIDNNKT